ncbi:MAG: thiamine diphosphokinase [Bacillota bacterium]|nr:thiamine diphosphokinase [Bacillota bacterium]
MKAVIVSSGSISNYDYPKKYLVGTDILIGVDGGAKHLRKMNVMPDILIGDFDSAAGEDLEYFMNAGVMAIQYPPEKDMTDTELAIDYAIDKGCTSIVLLGCLGTRIDHSLANVFLLKKMLYNNVNGLIANEQNEVMLIKDKIILKSEENSYITLLALSDKVEGVSTKGLLYPLDNADLELGSSWGVSNEFIEDIAEISIKKGLLLVIKSIEM